MESPTEFQERNCQGCFYADEENAVSGECLSKRNEKGTPFSRMEALSQGGKRSAKTKLPLPVIIASLRVIVNKKQATPGQPSSAEDGAMGEESSAYPWGTIKAQACQHRDTRPGKIVSGGQPMASSKK